MIKAIFYLFLLALAVSFLPSCQTITGKFPEKPHLEILSVAPLEPMAFRDSIIFTLFYRDGDGDLGENSPDAENLFIIDNRNGLRYAYRIPLLAPEGANVAIQGTLKVALKGTVLLNGGEEEAFTYSVFVRDRKGNESGLEEGPQIVVRGFE